MFCPGCGTQNSADLAFCRACGDDLKIISQAMNKHLPLVLVSKLDAAIERKNDNFRREAITSALMGVVFLVTTAFLPLGGSFYSLFNVSIFILGLFALANSAFNYLAFRRSLEGGISTSESNYDDESSLTAKVSEIEGFVNDSKKADAAKLVPAADAHPAVVYCPQCGTENAAQVLFCRSCGLNLDFTFSPQGMEKYLPTFLLKRLDRAIEKNEEKELQSRYQSGRAIFVVALVYLFNVALQLFKGDPGYAAIWFVSGIALAVTSLWNLAAYRRQKLKEGFGAKDAPASLWDELAEFLSSNKKIAALISAAALIPFVLLYFGINGAVLALFPLVIAAGLFLKFMQNRSFGAGGQLSGENLATNELSEPETLPLLSPSPIDEAATKKLNSTIKNDK